MKRCRKLVGLLGCARAGSVEAYHPAATQGHIGSSSHVPSSSRLVEEEEEEEEEATHEEEEEEAYHEEEEDESNEEEEYDEDYGPPPTQSSQPSQLLKRNPKKKDLLSPDPFQRPVPRRPKKKTEETRSKSNEDRTSKRGRSN